MSVEKLFYDDDSANQCLSPLFVPPFIKVYHEAAASMVQSEFNLTGPCEQKELEVRNGFGGIRTWASVTALRGA